MLALRSEALDLRIDPANGTLAIFDRRGCGRLTRMGVFLQWREGHRSRREDLLRTATSASPLQASDPQDGLSLQGSHDETLRFGLEFRLVQEGELLCWRAWIENLGDTHVILDRLDLLATDPGTSMASEPHLSSIDGVLGCGAEELLLFTQGWQSWSAAGFTRPGEAQPRTRLGPLAAPMMLSPMARRSGRRGSFVSEPYGSLLHPRMGYGLLLGFLSERQAFGSLMVDVRGHHRMGMTLVQDLEGIRLGPGRRYDSDWAALLWMDLQSPHPEEAFLRQAAVENQARTDTGPIAGWCSWYQYGQAIDLQVVQENLAWLTQRADHLPLEIFQIDDGYAREIGDWLEPSMGFPNGMAEVAAEVRRAGLTPGLWMAPFLARPGSKLLADHPDWLLRDRRSRPVNAGFVWDGFPRALDASHPAVLEALAQWVETAVHRWGFPYLKLDFLYAGGLPGRRWAPDRTGAQVLREALEAVRSAAGEDCHLVGCGCPLGTGIGIFDSMRIGPDVAPHWSPRYKRFSLFLRTDPSMPSARNAVRNTLLRVAYHRRWWQNDADCLILREAGSDLSQVEFESLATAVAMASETLMVSDRLADLPEARVAWLKRLWPPLPTRHARLLPPLESEVIQIVLPLSGPIGAWSLLATFNLSNGAKRIRMPGEALGMGSAASHAVDFWEARYNPLQGPELELGTVPAHGVRLLAIRPKLGEAQWVGDTLHISQGGIVAAWNLIDGGVVATLAPSTAVEGRIFLELPAPARAAEFDGAPCLLERIDEGIYSARVQAKPGSVLDVRW